MTRTALAIALIALLCGIAPASAGDYADDACPDRGGSALVVDTPAKAVTVANGYTLPTCHLIIRTSLDSEKMIGSSLRITAKSVTIEGPLLVHNPMADSRVVIVAHDGDIVVSGARLMAERDVWLECRGPADCGVTVQKGSQLRASKSIRTLARGAVKVDNSVLTSSDVSLGTRTTTR